MRQQSRVVVKAKLRARQRAAVKAAGGYCWVGGGANVVGGGGEQSADGDAAGLGAGGGERVLAAEQVGSDIGSARGGGDLLAVEARRPCAAWKRLVEKRVASSGYNAFQASRAADALRRMPQDPPAPKRTSKCYR